MSFENQSDQINQVSALVQTNNFENNSGKGKNYPVPDEVANKFNWGAFIFTWIWGIGNKTYITFVIFLTFLVQGIPIAWVLIDLLVRIWFGIYGNEWAWRNMLFESIEAFHSYQKKWAIVGIILLILAILFYALCILVVVKLGKT